MRILMIAPTPFFSDRGCHVRIYNSYKRLSKNNKITLVTYHLGRDIRNLDIKRISKVSWYNKIDAGPSFGKIYLDFKLLIKCLKLAKKYDLIYAHLHEGALIGYILKKFNNKILIFDCQDSLIKEVESYNFASKKSLMYKILSRIEKLCYENSDEIIVSNVNIKNYVEKNFNRKVTLITDEVDKEIFNTKVKKTNLKLPNKKIVVYLGGMQKNKGVLDLINAIPKIDKKYHFLLMGYPNEEAKKLSESLEISDRITFTGKIDYFKAGSYLKLGDYAISPKKTSDSLEANAKLYAYKAMKLKTFCYDTKENKDIMQNLGIYIKDFSEIR